VAKYSVSTNPNQMDDAFHALANPTRRNILERLTRHSLTVTEIANAYDFALPTISKHLSVLERAQLIKKKKIGREYVVSFEPTTMKSVAEYVSFYRKFWTQQLENLEKYLSESESGSSSKEVDQFGRKKG
jgi:DNA-binding transcriptional ArsR family regulator